jgi:putative peptidoglycan lipid II flippase
MPVLRYDAASFLPGRRMSALLKSTTVVGLMTLLSRISGFLRDTLLAILFGATPGMDAFLVAFKIPNFLRRIFAEGAFSQAFVPVLGETRAKGSDAEVRELLDVVTGTLSGVLLLVSVLGMLGAPLLILLFAPGFQHDAGKFALSIELLRLTFPYILFISLTALAGGVLNTFGRFAVPAFTPVFLNLVLISAAIWLSPHFEQPVKALALGVSLAGAVQLGFQLPFLRRMGMLPRLRWGWHDPKVRRILRLMVPVLFGSSVAQVNLLLDTVIASFLASGSVSWLYYADRLMEFPLGIFSVAIATVILPALSARHAEASSEGFSHTLDWSLRLLLLIVMPATVGLFVLAGPVIATLFQYRSFTADDAQMTRYALMAYAVGLLTFSLVKVLLPAYYARQDTRTPVRYGVTSLVAGMGMSIGFVLLMRWLGWPAPHAGLALAVALGALVNATLLYRGLRRQGIYSPAPGWRRYGWQLAASSLVMGVLLWWLAGDTAAWLLWGPRSRGLHLVGLIAAGVGTYGLMLVLLGLRPRDLQAPRH